MRRRVFRLLAAILGAALARGSAEVGLRLLYPALPSLVGLQGWSWQPTPCQEGAVVAGEGGPRALGMPLIGVFGDSVAAGFGLDDRQRQRFGALLAAALSGGGQPWAEWNEGRPGAGWCPSVQTAAQRVQQHQIRIAVLELFADDLAVHARLQHHGRMIRFPAQASPALRPLIEGSWLLNLIWLAASAADPSPDRRALSPDDQAAFLHAISALSRTAAAQHIPLVIALLPPIGLGRCPADPPAASACAWMPHDLALLADLLIASGAPWLDLRDVYGADAPAVPAERDQPPGGLALHPDPGGHRRIAARLLALLQQIGAAPAGATLPPAR